MWTAFSQKPKFWGCCLGTPHLPTHCAHTHTRLNGHAFQWDTTQLLHRVCQWKEGRKGPGYPKSLVPSHLKASTGTVFQMPSFNSTGFLILSLLPCLWHSKHFLLEWSMELPSIPIAHITSDCILKLGHSELKGRNYLVHLYITNERKPQERAP